MLPLPGTDVMEREPPENSVRSFMLARPNPRLELSFESSSLLISSSLILLFQIR
jgi:hypothetical protein